MIALDIGTSFIKCATLDVESGAVGPASRAPFPGFIEGLPPGHREVYPGAILDAVASLLSSATASEGIILCGQMHGVVLVNRRGEAVSNYISWLDQRISAEEFAQLASLLTPAELAEIGNEFSPGIAAPLLWWLKRHGALPEGEVTPVSIADFIAGRLCGVPPIMEPTQAAAFGALRLATSTWHEDVIEKLGLTGLRWPDVRPAGSIVGSWRRGPCYASIGDQQCALAGALLGGDEISVNIGTGSQVGVLTGTLAGDAVKTRPYFERRFLRTITHIPGGRALSALVRLLTELGGPAEEDAWPAIEAAVNAVPVTDLRANAAFYPGPCGDGGFFNNLHESNLSVGHLFRATFQSMARNYAECAVRLAPENSPTRIVFSGGVARRLPVLRDLTAAALNLPYRLSPHAEDTMFGLAVLARAFSARA